MQAHTNTHTALSSHGLVPQSKHDHKHYARNKHGHVCADDNGLDGGADGVWVLLPVGTERKTGEVALKEILVACEVGEAHQAQGELRISRGLHS